MRTSEKVAEIAAALVKAQTAMKPAIKDAVNPHFKSKYADLSAVWDSIREPLTANGIAVLQDVDNHGQGIGVTTRLQHVSGEFLEFGPLVVPMAKDDAHGVGSACTYARRFALSAAVGVVADVDDDGNAAVEGKSETKRKPAQAAAPPPVQTQIPAYECVTDEQVEVIHNAAKAAGLKTLGELKGALLKLAGTDVSKHIPADKYEHVIEQLALLKATA